MLDVLMHPVTKRAVENVLASGQSVLALVGPYGSGRGYLANAIAQEQIGTNASKTNILRITAESEVIGIDQVRLIQSNLKLKVPGTNKIRRVIIIENAQLMTTEAQNALLKTLEEPPEDTCIILTLTIRYMLLPTVLSRLKFIDVLPLQPDACRQLAEEFNNSGSEVERAILISGGYAALFVALISDSNHKLAGAIADAKSLLRANTYERLVSINNLAGSKEKAELILFGLKRILSAAARQSATPMQEKSIAKKLQHVHQSEASLSKNPNQKLLITNLAINI